MKTKCLMIVLLCTSIIVGCGNNPLLSTTPNPAYITTTPNGLLVTNSAVAPIIYTPSPNVITLSNEFGQVVVPLAQAALSTIPVPGAQVVSSSLPSISNMVFGGIAGILGIIAAWKNNSTNKHAAAASALASAVVTNPAVAQLAMTNAQTNGSVGLVALHIASVNSPT
jgi:hypothetical protein